MSNASITVVETDFYDVCTVGLKSQEWVGTFQCFSLCSCSIPYHKCIHCLLKTTSLFPLLFFPFLTSPSFSFFSSPPPHFLLHYSLSSSLSHCWTLKSLSKVVKRSLWLFNFFASGSCSFENLKDIYTHCSTINEVISPSNDHQMREDSRSYKCNVLCHIQWTLVEVNTRKIRTKSLEIENV